jgi:predicted dithiol-disulfide oxidoreductase (DUF899 family)
MQPNEILSPQEWLAARTARLAKEKTHMRAGDDLDLTPEGRKEKAHAWPRPVDLNAP